MRQFGVVRNIFNPFHERWKKRSHHFHLPLVFNMSKQFLAPGGLSAECVQASVM